MLHFNSSAVIVDPIFQNLILNKNISSIFIENFDDKIGDFIKKELNKKMMVL